MEFFVNERDPASRARTGVLKTDRGLVETPSYVIVATHGAIRCLEPSDIPATKTQMVIANTYHLWRMLGDEGLNDFPGMHKFINWNGTVMTDSGGFQVFSLGFLRERGMRRGNSCAAGNSEEEISGESLVRISEAGVLFNDKHGEEHYLDAELSVKIQEQLGGDIIVAFDEPTSPIHDFQYTKEAMIRTHSWAKRSLESKNSSQAMYGVVQGGGVEDLRRESARFIGDMDFDGFAIGSTYAEAYGGTQKGTADMLDWTMPLLPGNKPRHLFGVGRVSDLFLGVEQGIDTFDCTVPTREARHGRIWTKNGHLDITRGMYSESADPLEEDCGCPVCETKTKGEVYDLFRGKSPLAGTTATIHNVYFFNDLMSRIRKSIREGGFSKLKNEYLPKVA